MLIDEYKQQEQYRQHHKYKNRYTKIQNQSNTKQQKMISLFTYKRNLSSPRKLPHKGGLLPGLARGCCKWPQAIDAFGRDDHFILCCLFWTNILNVDYIRLVVVGV